MNLFTSSKSWRDLRIDIMGRISSWTSIFLFVWVLWYLFIWNLLCGNSFLDLLSSILKLNNSLDFHLVGVICVFINLQLWFCQRAQSTKFWIFIRIVQRLYCRYLLLLCLFSLIILRDFMFWWFCSSLLICLPLFIDFK